MKSSFINFRWKNYNFSPTFLPSLAFLSLFFILINLGIWQIHRGIEKKRIEMLFSKENQLAPIYLNQLNTVTNEKIYSSILAEGQFDNAHSFLLDNKIYQHQIGYEVLTPFILKKNHATILVNRGWIPQGYTRNTLPFIKAIVGNVLIQGLLFWPKKTFSFKITPEKNWPQRIQILTPQFLNQQGLKPFIIVIDKKSIYSFIPIWKPSYLQARRHFAYACQWFALSLTLIIAFCITQTHRL
ncbi:MAG: SURF1 family protein [Rickettsiella sp.]|nr:SURF1 family protein [Rickettsiella sp.]